MRTMYDSTSVTDIPAAAVMVAPYVDGDYANLAAARQRFPKARIVPITVTGGTLDAAVVDIETGDCTPKSGVAWVARKAAAKQQGSPYCNLSTLPAVLEQIDLQKLPRSTPIWTAHPTGKAHLCDAACFAAAGLRLPFTPNIVATQYAWPEHGSGGHFDVSLAASYWPGVDPAPLSLPWWYHRPLKRGMSGADVVACKRRLYRLGYRGLKFSPTFGVGLERAVRLLQQRRLLPVTGVVDDRTAHAIRVS